MMRKSLEDRLLTRITVVTNGCWNWNGTKNKAGYGRIFYRHLPRVHEKCYYSHRLS